MDHPRGRSLVIAVIEAAAAAAEGLPPEAPAAKDQLGGGKHPDLTACRRSVFRKGWAKKRCGLFDSLGDTIHTTAAEQVHDDTLCCCAVSFIAEGLLF